MGAFGFGAIEQHAGCKHDSWLYREMGGIAFRVCEGCGGTHVLWQFKDGTFKLIEVAVVGPEAWDQVASEHEDSEQETQGDGDDDSSEDRHED